MGWVSNATAQPLYPRERDPVPIVQELGPMAGLGKCAKYPLPHWDWIPGAQEGNIKMNQTLNPGTVANEEITSICQHALSPKTLSGFP
jgi:hypothetical protein